MVAGGLAGASPHMISATVTAISRLVFEFKGGYCGSYFDHNHSHSFIDTISPTMHTEILATLLVFLSSANREIVKSILGFIKLAIHTLPLDLLRPHLKEIVPGLLNWSHDHKNHFKLKVRHIFERMLRRFTWEEVYSCAGEEEAAKVLLNIKKRKERAKRKKANRAEEGDDDEVSVFVSFKELLQRSLGAFLFIYSRHQLKPPLEMPSKMSSTEVRANSTIAMMKMKQQHLPDPRISMLLKALD